jgi:thiol-disulfide isomerase/thioredoxin
MGGLRRRLVGAAGLVVIVGAAVGILALAGVIGGESGGEGIENVALLDPLRAAGQEQLEVGTSAGQLAPDFEISDINGVRHRLSDYRGKVVYLNFWATWCEPCLVELGEIQELQDRNPETLAVVAVNRRQDVGDAEGYLRDLPRVDGGSGVSFAVNGLDPDDTLYDRYVRLFPEPMPVSIFVNADGVVTDVLNGQIRLAQMEQAVTEAQASTSAARVPAP